MLLEEVHSGSIGQGRFLKTLYFASFAIELLLFGLIMCSFSGVSNLLYGVKYLLYGVRLLL